jgi:valyl-tRNA synthetase
MNHKRHFESLTKIKRLDFLDRIEEGKFTATAVVEDFTITVELPEEMIEQEIARLAKELERIEKDERQVSKKVESDKFRSRAPREVVEKELSRLEQLKQQKSQIKEKLARLK